MRMTAKTYEIVRAAIRAVVENYGGPTAVRKAYANLSTERMLWDTWNLASFDLRNDDDHPFYTSGKHKRVCAYVPGFDVYREGLNDTHIATALRKIGRELELIAD